MFVFGTAEDVFTMAIRIEENGNAFYAGAASRADDPKVKTLFEELANMEEGHIRAFKALRSLLPDLLASGAVWDPEGLAESYLQASADTHVFTVEAAKARLEKGMTPAQVLQVAIQFEKDSVVFFLGMKELLPDQKGKGEIDRLILSEMDHIRMLSAAAKKFAQTGTAIIA